MTHKIIDNLLPEELYIETKNNFLEYFRFPWFYNNFKVSSTEPFDLNSYQFTHLFYDNNSIRSDWFQIVEPIVKYLNPKSVIRIKANLNPRTNVQHIFPYHVDFSSESSDRKTAIYYVNSNDGVTILEDGTEIESIANRLVIFDQKTRHTGTTCINQKVRCLINFNYIERCDD